jgi:hypothetical protein
MISLCRLAIGARETAALALLALPIATAAPTTAQPSPEQIATMRQACRADFITHCSGVQPGGREALQCLERNAAQLSTECGNAVSAVVPKAETKPETPQPAAAEAAPPQPSQPSQQDELAAVQQACTIKDFMSHCSWIQPGNPELLLCLRANAAELSPACQSVVRSPPGATPSVAAAPPVTAPQLRNRLRRSPFRLRLRPAPRRHRSGPRRSRPARSAPPAVRISSRTAPACNRAGATRSCASNATRRRCRRPAKPPSPRLAAVRRVLARRAPARPFRTPGQLRRRRPIGS